MQFLSLQANAGRHTLWQKWLMLALSSVSYFLKPQSVFSLWWNPILSCNACLVCVVRLPPSHWRQFMKDSIGTLNRNPSVNVLLWIHHHHSFIHSSLYVQIVCQYEWFPTFCKIIYVSALPCIVLFCFLNVNFVVWIDWLSYSEEKWVWSLRCYFKFKKYWWISQGSWSIIYLPIVFDESNL